MQDPFTAGNNTKIGGFQYAMSYLFASSVVFNFGGAVSSNVFEGSLANEMVRIVNSEITCQDPMDRMLDALREITFRTAVIAGKNADTRNITNADQQMEYQGYELQSIYITDWKFMAIAALLSFSSIIAVGATFYGWWELGRPFSMGPLELASAFEAPLLKAAGEDAGLGNNTVREPRVQFGEKVVDDNGQFPSGLANRRLVLGLSTDVQRPRKGTMYT
ncbi:hypothetical protein IG631_11427 [Alternaria alternata]|nr:hypothetical protein IG631_11427 [Alternaria alternata]